MQVSEVISFPAPGLNEAGFLQVCELFPDDFLEYTADGHVIVSPPSDLETSQRVVQVCGQLVNWARVTGGVVVGPDVGFHFANGARRSPDASWFDEVRWENAKAPGLLFPVFAPKFAAEVRRPFDHIVFLRDKMREYIANGVQLAWLIDPFERTVDIYRPDREPETLTNPTSVEGEGPVAGFVLTLERVFTA